MFWGQNTRNVHGPRGMAGISPSVAAMLQAVQNQGRMTVGSGLLALGRGIGAAIGEYKAGKRKKEQYAL